MKSINFRFIGHDHLLMDLCKSHISQYSFVKCMQIIKPNIFLKQQIAKKADVVLVDLPIDSQGLYEFGIHLKRIFPHSKIIAIAHRNDFSKLLHLQHIEKLFEMILDRDSAVNDLDRIISCLKKGFNLTKKRGAIIDFTCREKEVIKLTCKEYKNDEIAIKLRISHRTVETHKSNIYVKLGSKNPARLFNYASEFRLI